MIPVLVQLRRPSLRMLLPATWAVLAGAAAAQSPVEPATPSYPVAVKYTSPFSKYRAYRDQPVQSWREANDRVGRIGGWRAYAKELKTGKPANDGSSTSDPGLGHHGARQP